MDYYKKNFGWIMRELKERIRNSSTLGMEGVARIEDLETSFEKSEINALIQSGEAYNPRPRFIRLSVQTARDET